MAVVKSAQGIQRYHYSIWHTLRMDGMSLTKIIADVLWVFWQSYDLMPEQSGGLASIQDSLAT